ncbi:recombination regulator RecX [Legionella worsleiensis]|uniref:Regulatory protein RecX n=1 Tax=Legionella worsleiensis TaxID=45076 RepID=A0A0W1AIQ2_9GAMM|nr:recombination regulator RecX [Legionella worsleiensis]KTD81233.1 Regulatory protein RecX [Legionella worsleiensis]STY33210.1 Regulatory protein RecX [Legionella worsleiensis]
MTKAFDSAIRLLSRREHGAIELYKKLEQKDFDATEIQDALDTCQRLGLQNDVRFVEQFIRMRIRQGYGPLKIMHELKSKGVEAEIINAELAKERDNWLVYALNVWEKKSKGRHDLDYTEQQKQQRFLLYRGFSPDIIALVIKELK